MDIAVFASGDGTNLQAIIDGCKSNIIRDSKVCAVVSDNPNAYALERAAMHRIRTIVVPKRKGMGREEHEEMMLKRLGCVDLVALAGYMRIVSPYFLEKFSDDSLGTNRVMNVHPSLLPAFKGSMDAYADAIKAGVKVTGVTAHFVTDEVDGGPIILQEPVRIYSHYNIDTLRQMGQEVEHKIYPRAISLFVSGSLSLSGNYVRIDGL